MADMSFRDAAAQARAYKEKMVTPFARLDEVLSAAARAEADLPALLAKKDQAEKDYHDYVSGLETARTTLGKDLLAAKAETEQAIQQFRKSVADESHRAELALRDLQKQVDEARTKTGQQVMEYETRARSHREALEADTAKLDAAYKASKAKYDAFLKSIGAA